MSGLTPELAAAIGEGIAEAADATLPGLIERQMSGLRRDVAQAVQTGLAQMPVGRDGIDGRDGSFAPPVDWHPTREFPRGTVATHKGATWFAERRTDREPGIERSGWTEIVRGVSTLGVEYKPDADARTMTVVIGFSDGSESRHALELPIVEHCGRWEPQTEYTLNQEVTWHGSTWRRNRIGVKGEEPGASGSWTLVAKQGGRGKQGETGVAGPIGKMGEEGPRGARGPKGDEGPQGPAGMNGESFPMRGLWELGDRYSKGDIVLHNFAWWRALEDTDTVPRREGGAWKYLVPAQAPPVHVGGSGITDPAVPTPTVTVTTVGDLAGVAAGPNNSFVILDDGINPKRTFERVENELIELGAPGGTLRIYESELVAGALDTVTLPFTVADVSRTRLWYGGDPLQSGDYTLTGNSLTFTFAMWPREAGDRWGGEFYI